MSGRALIGTQLAPLAGVFGVASAASIVDKAVIYNSGALSVNVAFHIIPAGGPALTSNQVGVKNLAAGYSYHCPELVGAWLATGDSIGVVPSIAGVLTVYSGVRS